jgi:plastocyanin
VNEKGRAVLAVLALLASVLLATVLLGGCGSSGSSGAAASGPPTAGPTIVNGTQVFDVTGTSDLDFVPSTLLAHPGRITVRLHVQPGSATHNFALPMAGAQSGFAVPGGVTTVTFTVNSRGTYPFICTIHQRMRGTLVVS